MRGRDCRVNLLVLLCLFKHQAEQRPQGGRKLQERKQGITKGLGGGLVLPVRWTDGKSEVEGWGAKPRFPASPWLSPTLNEAVHRLWARGIKSLTPVCG